VDAPRRIFNEKEEEALRKGLIASLAISLRRGCVTDPQLKTSRTSEIEDDYDLEPQRELSAICVCRYLTCPMLLYSAHNPIIVIVRELELVLGVFFGPGRGR
jgi:hypothetical protein